MEAERSLLSMRAERERDLKGGEGVMKYVCHESEGEDPLREERSHPKGSKETEQERSKYMVR